MSLSWLDWVSSDVEHRLKSEEEIGTYILMCGMAGL